MQISGEEISVAVTFEVPLSPDGVVDLTHYVLQNPGGGVPIAPVAIEPVDSGTALVSEVVLTVNKPTNACEYSIQVQGLFDEAHVPYSDQGSFIAVASPPTVRELQLLSGGELLVTFSERMRVDQALVSPAGYRVVAGDAQPDVSVKATQTVAPDKVMLTTVGMRSGPYTLELPATLQDIAGNPLDPASRQNEFTGSPALASRSVFTDRGPIAKPALTLQSGTGAVINSTVQLTLPNANITPAHVGLLVSLTGLNEGQFKITQRVAPTVVKVAASLTPEPENLGIDWALVDPRDGQIADDPSDVVVRINQTPVVPEAVVGLLGQVVLPTVPLTTDVVDIKYHWVRNPVVDFRAINSKEFRLNNWNRDNNQDFGRHRYRYNNTLISPETFEPLDLRAELAQPQQRDLKYRAYERAYSVGLNNPSLLLLNTPHHRIAYPPLARTLESSFVNYEGTVLPEGASDPWERHGTGAAVVDALELVVTDNSALDTIFWTRAVDLTFDHVFAIAWRMRVEAVPALDGVFTGIAAGYSDDKKVLVVGYLDDGSRKFGVLKRDQDPSSIFAWTGGLDSVGGPTDAPAEVDWNILHGYRVFRDPAGIISVFLDGSVVPTLQVASEDLPSLDELNAPFTQLQGAFFGSLSSGAQHTVAWSFVRYAIIPTNPLQSAPSITVEYDGSTLPESAVQPWTPLGSHGTETIVDGSLLLDSTSAADLPSTSAAGLISGDFRGYARIEPLLSEAFNTVLDIDVAVLTATHGVTPNAVMAAIDDGERLIQLSFLSEKAAPKISYGGRTLPPDFGTDGWTKSGTANASMVGQFLQISDDTTTDGVVYSADDLFPADGPERVLGNADYMLEFRVKVLSYTADQAGFAGVMSSVDDSSKLVGIQLIEVSGERHVELHSGGVPKGRFAFDWFDDEFHTYRARKSTAGDMVSLFVDGQMLGSATYGSFEDSDSVTGLASFGSSTLLSMQAVSKTQWAYSNYWRVDDSRKFVGLWKGYDPHALTGYHLPLRVAGKAATVSGNVLFDPVVDFSASGVQPGAQLVIDTGSNKGVYTVQSLEVGDAHRLLFEDAFPVQPAEVAYRVIAETDWFTQRRYRIVKSPSVGVSVSEVQSNDATVPLLHADYSAVDLPPSTVGIPWAICNAMPAVVWGAFDPTNLSQSSWDHLQLLAVRSVVELGIVPHHQVLNQRNIMASFEHHRTQIRHPHTNFWSESEGIPPQTEPDLLRNPDLIAFTLLNEGTPLVPSTQTYEVRFQPLVVHHQSARGVPDDILYNSLQVIERTTGALDLLAPLDDEVLELGSFEYQKEVCLTYAEPPGGDLELPEQDPTATTPWSLLSDDPQHVTTSVADAALTYGTDDVGTRTLYRNNTPLLDTRSLHTEVTFRLKLLQDSSQGLGDSLVRVGYSCPGMTLGLAFVTTRVGSRYVLVVDLNNGQTVGGIAFDFYDGAYHDYRLLRDPSSNFVQISIDA